MKKILEVNNLHYYYGDIHTLKGISFDVDEGEIVTLIGANGAGKTTTLRCISGLLGNIKDGEIIFNGKAISKMKPHVIPSLGVVQVLEGRRIFPLLTVHENLMMGAYLRKDKDTELDIKHVFDLFPRLEERKNQLGGTLSGGEQQMLAIGRALMSKPKILLMDEPSLGLAPLFVKEIFRTITRINNEGMTILLVEQNSKAALNISNRGYIMETGKIVLTDNCKNLINNEEVKSSYLGA
jgi:branched-chain amino acid transport system ATP-binding protein